MSHQCHNGSCSTEHHSHSKTCGCGCENCCCGSAKHSCGHECKYSDELLALADEAWMEVIKEKIKEEILAHSGAHIAELAALVSKTNHARWNYKLDEKKIHHEYEDALKNLIFHRK